MKALILLFGTFMTISAALADNASGEPVNQKKKIVLLGASIGQQWNLAGFSERVSSNSFDIEALQEWRFEKNTILEDVLIRPKRKFKPTLSYFKGFFKDAPKKPDATIIKECSSYFPGDVSNKEELVQSWIQQIKDKDIKPVLATVITVTKSRSDKDKGKQEAILKYNQWVRVYSKENNIALLDFESVLIADEANRFLKDEYTSGDGSHLNSQAYKLLDSYLLDQLCVIMSVRC